jgi:hypothetical protein
MSDEFSNLYAEFLDGTYDCVDRIVLNGYFRLAMSAGGFRSWWSNLRGGDADLDNTHLMRFAGRFSRRVRAYTKRKGIPLIYCKQGQRKEQIAQPHIPSDPKQTGVFCILVGRAPALLWDIQRYKSGRFHIERKSPQPYVNQYAFHIMDPEWGHVIIKLCPHPPFCAQIILNGHEFVARQATKSGLGFTKEGNCFTRVSDVPGLARVADTLSAERSVGRLVQVCERWIYSACLCFALGLQEQRRSGFHYDYSLYQGEYSRNLLFRRGHQMDQVFHGVIDRTRAPLNIHTVKTIFGTKARPRYCRRKPNRSRVEVVVERPTYDLTVFKIHFRRLTVKIYTKGERTLRIEAIAHNTEDLRCGRSIERFPRIIANLKHMVERFLSLLRSIDASFIDLGTLEELPLPSKVGALRIAGIDLNKPRARAVLQAVIALSTQLNGFSVSDLAAKACEIQGGRTEHYGPRQAAYDLKKLRSKALVEKIERTRRYRAAPQGLRSITALLVLREKVIKPLVARAGKRKNGIKPKNRGLIDEHYEQIQIQMQELFRTIGIAC